LRTHDIDQEEKPFFGVIYRGVIRRTRCLSREEEARLVLAYQEYRDADAARILVESFLPWIASQTDAALQRFKRSMDSRDDAMGCAVTGFLEGVSRWDPSHEARLSSFVAAYVVSAVANADRHVLCMTHSQGHSWRKAAWREAWILEGEHPTTASGRAHCTRIADRFSLESAVVENVAGFLALTSDTASLAEATQPAPAAVPAQVFSSAKRALVAAIRSMLSHATPRQREVWPHVLARQVSDHPPTFEEIGRSMGICKERVRQLETVLLSKLQTHMRNQGFTRAHETIDAPYDAKDMPVGFVV